MNSWKHRQSALAGACLVALALEGQAFLSPASSSSCFPLESVGTHHRATAAAAKQQITQVPTAYAPLSCSHRRLLSTMAVSSEQVDVPGQWSPVRDSGSGGNGRNDEEEEEEDFNINVGRAMDYLPTDVKGMFCVAPRLEIFTPEVRLKDPVGELCHGRRLYGALHTSLRVFGVITSSRPRVSVTSTMFNKDKHEIELKWTMAANAPFMGDTVKMSAVSLYKVDNHGLIYEHAIDNRIKRDLWEYSHSWMGVLKADRPPSA